MKLFTIFLGFFSLCTFAQSLHYPELEVTPRATERVKIETQNESSDAWTSNLPIQVSAVATFVAGAMSAGSIDDDKEDGKLAPTLAIGVGALWIGATTWAAMKYRPYKQAYADLKKYPYKSEREKLIAERMAEEELDSLARLGRNMRYLSVATNLAASAFMLENVEQESDAKFAAGISALLSLTPLFFKYSWEKIACDQKKYKKKIYSPITMAPMIRRTSDGNFTSGLSLAYQF